MSHPFEVNAAYQPVVAWLLSTQEPWVVYNALLEFAGASRESPEVEAAYTALQ